MLFYSCKHEEEVFLFWKKGVINLEKITSFFKGVKKEVDRVRWPNKKNMIKYSTAVISLCAFFCLYFYIINVVVVLLKDVLK